MTLILLNGPPRSGKDTAAAIIGSLLPQCSHWKLSEELKERTHSLYRLVTHDYLPRSAGAFEATKDVPSPLFFGLTPRQAYIEMHERYLKPVHGPRILGTLLLENILRPFPISEKENIVVSDAGDAEQCMPLVEFFRPQHTLLIHLDRNGCTWDNRVRFTLPGVRTIPLDNSCDVPTLRSAIRSILYRESPFPSDLSSGSAS